MLSDRVMARLGQLSRSLPDGELASRVRAAGRRRAAPSGEQVAIESSPLESAGLQDESAGLQDGLEGREVETPVGNHWLVEQPVFQLWPSGPRYLERHASGRRAADSRAWTHPQLELLRRNLPRNLLLLDLETCGFAGSMVFLIGGLYERDEQLWLSQWLARNYAEERAILYSLWQVVRRKPLLVTFNGKSFDWPMIRDRTTLHRLSEPLSLGSGEIEGTYGQLHAHCDLLHHARRHWKGQLPNYRLQTLERHICGRRREGDIPGRLIPDAYHRFARSGETDRMRAILHHNALDLLTLLQLSLALA